MQKHVADKFRPKASRDPHGVEQAHAQIEKAYGILETTLTGRTWAAGETFSMADCAAAPRLYYANLVHPIAAQYERVTSYLKRLESRPSFARVLVEAQPYFAMFPG